MAPTSSGAYVAPRVRWRYHTSQPRASTRTGRFCSGNEPNWVLLGFVFANWVVLAEDARQGENERRSDLRFCRVVRSATLQNAKQTTQFGKTKPKTTQFAPIILREYPDRATLHRSDRHSKSDSARGRARAPPRTEHRCARRDPSASSRKPRSSCRTQTQAARTRGSGSPSPSPTHARNRNPDPCHHHR